MIALSIRASLVVLVLLGLWRQPEGPPHVASGTVKISIAQPDLDWFINGEIDTLKKQLRADPRWRVWNDPWSGGDLVAHERRGEGKWIHNLHGGGSPVMYRFSAEPEKPHRLFKSLTSIASPDAGEFQLGLFIYRGMPSRKQSCLCVGRTGLWLQIDDDGPEEARQTTNEALVTQSQLLKSIRSAAAEIKEKGFARALLPEDAIRRGKPSLQVSDISHTGVRFRAWINPGKAGSVYLKLFSVDDGRELSDAKSRAESGEEVAWSSDPEELFYANGQPLVERLRGSFDTRVKVRAELWFRSADKKEPDVKLVETAQTIQQWEH